MIDELHSTGLPLAIYNTNGRLVYCEYKEGFWWKHKYDSNGNVICGGTSTGNIYEYA